MATALGQKSPALCQSPISDVERSAGHLIPVDVHLDSRGAAVSDDRSSRLWPVVLVASAGKSPKAIVREPHSCPDEELMRRFQARAHNEIVLHNGGREQDMRVLRDVGTGQRMPSSSAENEAAQADYRGLHQ